MNELALFAGAGGGILGGKLLGWRTVCAVEIEPYAAGVLLQRQNDGILEAFPIWDDIRTFDGRPWRGIVDVVSGGFPCQDISAAGGGAGITGERSGLWREMARVVREVEPRYVLVENSPMLTIRGLGTVLGDLATMGYDAEWGVLGADDAGAPHIRKRIWILAYTNSERSSEGCKQPMERQPLQTARFGERGKVLADTQEHGREPWGPSDTKKEPEWREFDRGGIETDMADTSRILEGREEQWAERQRVGQGGESIDVSNSDGSLCDGRADQQERQPEGGNASFGIRQNLPDPTKPGLSIGQGERRDNGKEQSPSFGTNWWIPEPNVGRVANGVAARVDRLKAIGNGQVPAVVRLAWDILKNDSVS